MKKLLIFTLVVMLILSGCTKKEDTKPDTINNTEVTENPTISPEDKEKINEIVNDHVEESNSSHTHTYDKNQIKDLLCLVKIGDSYSEKTVSLKICDECGEPLVPDGMLLVVEDNTNMNDSTSIPTELIPPITSDDITPTEEPTPTEITPTEEILPTTEPIESVPTEYKSSEEVIIAFWKAAINNDKDAIKSCMFPKELESLLNDDNFTVGLDSFNELITVLFDNIITENLGPYTLSTEEAERLNSKVNCEKLIVKVPIVATDEGISLRMMLETETITYQYNNNWYVFNIKDTDYYLIDENFNRINEDNDMWLNDGSDPLIKDGPELTGPPIEEVTDPLINNTLSTDIQTKFNALETDVTKVNWLVQYSPIPDYPELVFSITPYVSEYSYQLVIGITNLGDIDLTIDGHGTAKSATSNDIGNTYLHISNLAPNDTYIETIYCDDMPNGSIYWDNLKISNSMYKSLSWTSDWTVSKDNMFTNINYTLNTKDKFSTALIFALVLDENGYVIGLDYDVMYDSTKTSNSNTLSILDDLNKLKDIAFFANVYKYEY